jgi:uncharacterized ferritin-like protein (DUF455 family)
MARDGTLTTTVPPSETITVRGAQLRRDPARESCFTVVHTHAELHLARDFSDVNRREKLHREVNNEIQSLEIGAQSLVDFPRAPWQLRMQLARQCWDETRHAALFFAELRALGGRKGEFPIANHEWGVVCQLASLPARLAVQNRSFEAGSLDSMRKAVAIWQEAGEEQMARATEAVLTDEIEHVRFANHWLRQLSSEDPTVLLDVASAMATLKHTVAQLSPRPDEMSVNGLRLGDRDLTGHTSVEDRAVADFTEGETNQLLQPRRDEPR